jgi:4-amino-4-deoxy-L-arabinose transferase-like glycosyltransferase
MHRERPECRQLGFLLFLAVAVFAAGLGLRDPWPADEPRFVLVARQMVESGEYLIPHRGSEIYAHKPPPFMWLLAAAHHLTGEWRIAFLLPSLAAALLTLWLVADLARRLYGERVALPAAVALFVTLQFGLQAKRAQIDMVLVALTTLALWALARALLAPERRRLALLGGLAAGVGTVTKGVGFLPLLLYLPARLARRLPTRIAHAPWLLGGFLLGTLVWLAPLGLRLLSGIEAEMAQYLREIFLRQTAERYFDPWHHHQPPWYYLQVIATLWLPGALLLPWLIPAWWRRIQRGDPRAILLVGWAVLVLLFFTLSPGKREVYIFPALPALCVAAAPLLRALLRKPWPRRLLLAYPLALALLAFAAAALLAGESKLALRLAAERGLSPEELGELRLGLLLLGLALAPIPLLARRSPGRGLVLLTALIWTIQGAVLAPVLDRSSSARGLMEELEQRLAPERALALLGWREQHLLQARRPARTFGFERPLVEQAEDAERWLREDPQARALFIAEELLPDCLEPGHSIHLGPANRRSYALLLGEALPRGCSLAPPTGSSPSADASSAISFRAPAPSGRR